MSNQENNQDRIVLNLTIDINFPKQDQELIGSLLEEIVNNLWLSGSGEGVTHNQGKYSYKLTSNQPSEPMTIDRMLDILAKYNQENE